MANATQFNGVAILTGGSTAMSIQIGANTNNPATNDNVFVLNVTPAGNFYVSTLSPTMTSSASSSVRGWTRSS